MVAKNSKKNVTIAINTASRGTEVALINHDGKVLAEKSWASKNDEAEKLMPAIHALLKKQKLLYDDLEKVFVIKGPGSFTGLRIGVSAANTFSYLLNIPVYAIDTFNYLRAKNDDQKDAVLILLAGRSEVYLQASAKSEILLLKLEDAVKFLKDKKTKKIFGELLTEQKKFFKEFEFLETGKSFGETMADIKETKLMKTKIIEPFYVKEPSISAPRPIK